MRIIYLAFVVILFASTLLIGVTAQTYDPWYDLNQDGEIDIFDVVEIAGRYGSSGTPLNRSELWNENAGWFPPPAYDSGWIEILPTHQNNITLTHNLNTTEVFVYAIGRTNMSRIHQGNYGENWYPYLAGGGQLGIKWYNLNATCITLERGRIDPYAPYVSWNYTRIMIWKIGIP